MARCNFACWFAFVSLVALAARPASSRGETPVDYGRHIQPILAKKCYACHGPDEAARQADLRLDQPAAAIEYGVIVPGDPEGSELVRRIFSDDPLERMPPPDAPEMLTDAERDRLRAWIEQGASAEPHWAFVPPVQPPLPPSDGSPWPRNAIDRFVHHRLRGAGLSPSPPADRYTLIRRVYLDLIGLPPTPEEADAFVADRDPAAYEKWVDRLLASPQYGQRWARPWLDLARYSDTNGYEKDRRRSIWPYRDWVVDALNRDLPYDQFTIEQLAGDMLPGATQDQRIATGFHRNTMLNEEGGIDPLEFRFYAMVDRVATTGLVWMGLTTGCAQCHSHKFDPLTHTDFYALMALLNNADEIDMQVHSDQVAAKRQRIAREIQEATRRLPEHFPPDDGPGSEQQRRRRHFESALEEWIDQQRARVSQWTVLVPHEMRSNLPHLELQEDGSILASGDVTKRDVYTLAVHLESDQLPVHALRIEALPDPRLPAGGPGNAYYEGPKGSFYLSEVTARFEGNPVRLGGAQASHGALTVAGDRDRSRAVTDGDGSSGWSADGRTGQTSYLIVQLDQPLTTPGTLEVELLFERHFAASLGRFRLAATADRDPQPTTLPLPVEKILAQGGPHDPDQRQMLADEFAWTTPLLAEARKAIEAQRGAMPEFAQTMVMRERPEGRRRKTYRHHRGEYLSPREEVAPGIPGFLRDLTPDPPTNRLEFARWLVSQHNPMAGRLVVDRAWRAFFGEGLVKTSGDYGTQSDPPSHPDLLDWLAVDFMQHGWSLKRLHRQIVTSATYRQSSRRSPQADEIDPDNRLLSRGPRHRLEAELIRDAALKAAGLLSEDMGGPGVFPPQPASVTALAYGGFPWHPSSGADRYRRSLYTFSKRTTPFAAYTTFDAPSGENCTVRRDRSNTPLQALTLLNDPLFVEIAQTLAQRLPKDRPAREIATEIFRRFLTRPPEEAEIETLVDYYHAQYGRLASGQLDPQVVAGSPLADAETASWFLVIRAVLNLDETITKH